MTSKKGSSVDSVEKSRFRKTVDGFFDERQDKRMSRVEQNGAVLFESRPDENILPL